MKILLLGEFSNLHWTLAEGLRKLGHEVCVVSNGDRWRNYQRDISLTRQSDSILDGIQYVLQLLRVLPLLKGYDVVQLINPCFLHLKAQKCLYIYQYLRKHNKKVFLGAFGNDFYWTSLCMKTNALRYSEFKIGDKERYTANNHNILQECLYGNTAYTTKEIAQTCNGIIACLWEYYVAYIPYFPDKTTFIPLPIDYSNITSRVRTEPEKVNFFIGIQSARSDIKGTDMNSLLAMAKGVIVLGGGEEENYEIINEKELRPIINVYPSEEDIFQKLEYIVLNKERIPELSAQSIEYVRKHHNYVKVAQQYVDFWEAH